MTRRAALVERTFEYHTAEGLRQVRLTLSVPKPDRARRAGWRCRVRVTGLDRGVDTYAYGEDGMQALVLALEMARVILRTAPRPDGARLTWLDDEDLGIPTMLPGPPAA
ncbi:MAG: hypothetical protein AVDCRST_MAG11-421 [uncultured Gemmatimonadaceae bacterium]|uniref:DUF6968 domain-containing protein n=1 Tax=uncultured Gemmatimonadaceae bacterium TaxID=246130 RepID=A0A6J4K4Z0_9BACT|nr:MAG: hypothetical protein AVDCRST_MAG11-421 [uncultured Gemmatimonadaceae bacterium]